MHILFRRARASACGLIFIIVAGGGFGSSGSSSADGLSRAIAASVAPRPTPIGEARDPSVVPTPDAPASESPPPAQPPGPAAPIPHPVPSPQPIVIPEVPALSERPEGLAAATGHAPPQPAQGRAEVPGQANAAGNGRASGAASGQARAAGRAQQQQRQQQQQQQQQRSPPRQSRHWQKRQGFEWPVLGWVTSRFGRRTRGFHHGIDIACRWGTPIRTAKRGTVIHIDRRHPVYGRLIVVRHPPGGEYTTLYAHLARIRVGVGQRVADGQVIGRCGTSGLSTGPHLHFELRRGGAFMRPGHFLP